MKTTRMGFFFHQESELMNFIDWYEEQQKVFPQGYPEEQTIYQWVEAFESWKNNVNEI
jgi:hypothetical protein